MTNQNLGLDRTITNLANKRWSETTQHRTLTTLHHTDELFKTSTNQSTNFNFKQNQHKLDLQWVD